MLDFAKSINPTRLFEALTRISPDFSSVQKGIDAHNVELSSFFAKLVLISTSGCLCYSLAMYAYKGDVNRIIATLIISFAGPLCLLLLRKGRLRTMCAIYIWSIFGAIAVQSVIRGGLLNPGLQFSLVLILIAGWLLGKHFAFWLWLASMTWITVLTLASLNGWWNPLPSAEPGGYLLALATVWSIGFLAMQLVFNSYKMHVDHIQTLNNELGIKLAANLLAEKRVLQILSASPLPITVADYATGVYVDVNPAWERMFHYPKNCVIGKSSVDLGFWKNEHERKDWINLFSKDGRISRYEVSFRMRDSSEHIFLLSSERFLYGEQDCVLTMSVEVTERKRLENDLKSLNVNLEQRVSERTRELDQSNIQMQKTMETLHQTQHELVQSEKLASLGSLVAGVAHELNTPLGNALLASSTMQVKLQMLSTTISSGRLKKSVLDAFVAEIEQGSVLTQRSLQRAVALISSFKQVAVDQESERRRPFDLAQTAREVLETLTPNIKNKGISLITNIPAEITMDSFPGPLGQVLINLVNNALIHAFKDNSVGSIQISAINNAIDNQVVIEVCDDGEGMTVDRQHFIFDPFYTTKLGEGGSGLGLTVSHRIVSKILGGNIQVFSSPGKGSRFVMNVPLSAPHVIA
ncbi:MAG: ATP-binding protein [Rhodoferax sp.]|uniref:PAS domain-containing sensor histidine kinase n=1 Tax=Rhodoferax sp. TaxID=50421 RepID=UPI003016BC4D